jgi:hypothetical protein
LRSAARSIRRPRRSSELAQEKKTTASTSTVGSSANDHAMAPALLWSPSASIPQPAGGCANVSTTSESAIMIETPKNAWNGTGMSSSSIRPG